MMNIVAGILMVIVFIGALAAYGCFGPMDQR